MPSGDATATSTVTGTRYYAIGGVTIAARTAGLNSGNPQFLVPDRQGTDQLAIDSATLAVTRRQYTPFGQTRGTPPVAWPGNNGYIGGTPDPTTQLENLGAREYNPLTGRFLSPDPVFEHTDPTQMGGYDYAGNNPVTGSDPTGLAMPVCVDKCGDYASVSNPSGNPRPPAAWQGQAERQHNYIQSLYFGPVTKDEQRVRYTGKKMPGNGIIVSRFFIPTRLAAFGMLLGDDRRFTDDPEASYRMAIAWNTDTGDVTFTVSPSTAVEGPSKYQGFGDNPNDSAYFLPGDKNLYVVVPARQVCKSCDNSAEVSATRSGVSVGIHGLNSVLPVFTINGSVGVSIQNHHIRVEEQGTNYPNFETVQYRQGQNSRVLAQASIGPFGDANAIPGFPGRDSVWIDGKRQ